MQLEYGREHRGFDHGGKMDDLQSYSMFNFRLLLEAAVYLEVGVVTITIASFVYLCRFRAFFSLSLANMFHSDMHLSYSIAVAPEKQRN